MEPPTTLSLQEVAAHLGVHYMTAYRYVRLGLLPAVKEGASWRVGVADLERFASRGEPVVAAAGEGDGGSRGRGRTTPAPWAERLGNRLQAGDEAGAWGVVESALAGGADPASIYLDVLAPALRAIGEAWASGRIDVSVEHRASAVATRLVGRLGPRFARRGRSRGAVLVGSPEGDRHGLPVALFVDLVRGRGFAAVDLGADVPAPAFVTAAREVPSLVAVAVTVTTFGNEGSVGEVVDALHEGVPGVPVLAGGSGLPTAAAASAVGADGWAPDAEAALDLLDARVN